MNYLVNEADIGKRLDIFITEKNTNFTRSYVKKIIDDSNVLVNEKNQKAGYLLKLNDQVFLKDIEEKEISIKPKKMDINILYEDDDVIIINKKKGVVVHPRKWKL